MLYSYLNLVVKSLLQQFDITPNLKGPYNDNGDAKNELSAAEKELLDLTSDIDQEELTMAQQDDAMMMKMELMMMRMMTAGSTKLKGCLRKSGMS